MMVTPQISLSVLLQHRNTRYGWVVRIYSLGTSTLEETLSKSRSGQGRREVSPVKSTLLARGAYSQAVQPATSFMRCWVSAYKEAPTIFRFQEFTNRSGAIL